MSAFPDSRELRRRLTRLVVLECVQRVIAIGVLVAIAIRAVFVSSDRRTAIWISALIVSALAYLALAFRTRVGADHVRKDIHVSEARDAIARSGGERAHPYRLPAPK